MKIQFAKNPTFVCLSIFWIGIIAFVPVVRAGDSLGDPFDGNALKNPNWQWQNEPDKWDVGKTSKGWLHIVPKKNQTLWTSDTSIRLYQKTDAEKFDVETHIIMDYATTCIVSGLVALGPKQNNWTTLKFWGGTRVVVLQWQHRGEDVGPNTLPGADQPAGRVEVYLRMVKNGNNYKGWWKKQEGDDWIEITPDAPIDLTPPIQIGLYGGICTGEGKATIEYEYFKDNLNPFAVNSAGKLVSTLAHIKSVQR